MSIESRLQRLETSTHDALAPWCTCDERWAIPAVTIGAAEYLAGDIPPARCPVCGGDRLLEILVDTNEQRAALAALDKEAS
jgi:hypothetical protein